MKYMGSKSRIAKYIVPIIQKYIDDNDVERYVEPFCLAKDQIIYTENGIKDIGSVNIGESIYDDNCELSVVVNKIKSPNKKGKKIALKGNVEIKATDNHVFYLDNGQEIKVENIKIGDSLLLGGQKSVNPIIDLGDYITVSNAKHYGRNGCIVDNKLVRLYHNAPITNRMIPITKELMHCYGLVVAEGDKSNLTMHKNEIGYLKEFVENYENILNIKDNNNIKYHHRNNSCQLSVPYKSIYEKLFFQAMNVGYGARNKNISFLFKCTPEMCLEAIRYMIVGDGSIVDRDSGKYRSLNYKTASKTLAYQLQTLFAIKFGIKSTLSYGTNKPRSIEGRLLKETDYYNISITRNEDIEFITGISNNNIQIHEKSKGFIVTEITEIEDEFYDITLDNNSHRFIINGGIVTHNCGGANVIDKIKCKEKYGSDKNKYLIALLKRVQNNGSLYDEVPKSLYDKARECFNQGDTSSFEDWEIGNIGFIASFNGRWFDGGYAKTGYEKTKNGLRLRNYYHEAKNNILAQAPNLKNIKFSVQDYKKAIDLSSDFGFVIYCDPPYKDTKQYKNATKFDYEDFWQTMREWSKNNIVIISEQTAPDDFICIWEQEVNRSIKAKDKRTATEKLFIYNG